MINIKLLNLKTNLEEEVAQTKLWLSQKEVVEYTNWKNNPINKTDRSAMDKVVSAIKLEDEVWLQKEQDLISQEVALKMINIRYDVLKATLQAMSNPNSGVDLKLFNELQEEYLEGIKEDL